MKKLALIIAVAGIVGLSSCAKEGTSCTSGSNTITINDGKVESCVGTTCVNVPLGSMSEADYISSLETLGYECK